MITILYEGYRNLPSLHLKVNCKDDPSGRHGGEVVEGDEQEGEEEGHQEQGQQGNQGESALEHSMNCSFRVSILSEHSHI